MNKNVQLIETLKQKNTDMSSEFNKATRIIDKLEDIIN